MENIAFIDPPHIDEQETCFFDDDQNFSMQAEGISSYGTIFDQAAARVKLAELRSKGGNEYVDDLMNIIDSFTKGSCPFLPTVLVGLEHQLCRIECDPKYVKGYFDNTRLVSVSRVIDLSLRMEDGKYAQVQSISAPEHMNTDHLGLDMANNLAMYDEKGVIVPISGKGTHILSYMSSKLDGMYLSVFRVEVATYGTCNVVFRNNSYSFLVAAVPDRFPLPAFDGEMMGSTFVVFGDPDKSLVPAGMGVLMFERVYKLVYNKRFSPVEFLARATEANTDGAIVCVDGREYKIKEHPTVELKARTKNVVETGDKLAQYEVQDEELVPGKVYECLVQGKTATVLRMRVDKLKAQSLQHLNFVTRTMSISGLKFLVRDKKQSSSTESFKHFLPFETMTRILHFNIVTVLGKHNSMVISPQLVIDMISKSSRSFIQEAVAHQLIRTIPGGDTKRTAFVLRRAQYVCPFPTLDKPAIEYMGNKKLIDFLYDHIEGLFSLDDLGLFIASKGICVTARQLNHLVNLSFLVHAGRGKFGIAFIGGKKINRYLVNHMSFDCVLGPRSLNDLCDTYDAFRRKGRNMAVGFSPKCDALFYHLDDLRKQMVAQEYYVSANPSVNYKMFVRHMLLVQQEVDVREIRTLAQEKILSNLRIGGCIIDHDLCGSDHECQQWVTTYSV